LATKQWDAGHYNQRFAFIWQYGEGVLELLEPQSGERVLDLGCGTGHLTAKIAESGASVVGIDHSPEMVATAKASYPSIPFHQMDATSFQFDEPFDAVFSNATLHWVKPPEQAIQRIHAALKPGGRFVAEFGGRGNVEQVVRGVTAELASRGYVDSADRNPWFFPSIARYTALLEHYDLEPIFARLYDRPTLLDGGEDGLEGWLIMFADSFLRDVPHSERASIVAGVRDRLRPTLYRDGAWYADYRRLQVIAVRRA
jgi:SAM-dependent methyltransferase